MEKNAKIGTFFYKERKGTQRSERSFEKNGCPTLAETDHFNIFFPLFFRFTAHLGLGFHTLFIQYYSVICRPSDHPVGRPQDEIRTWDRRSRGKDSNH